MVRYHASLSVIAGWIIWSMYVGGGHQQGDGDSSHRKRKRVQELSSDEEELEGMCNYCRMEQFWLTPRIIVIDNLL